MSLEARCWRRSSASWTTMRKRSQQDSFEQMAAVGPGGVVLYWRLEMLKAVVLVEVGSKRGGGDAAGGAGLRFDEEDEEEEDDDGGGRRRTV